MNPPARLDVPRRLASIDAYRGLVIFLMMAEVLHLSAVSKALPDNPLWEILSHHQTHVEWIGCSLHDLIQPSFSFLVGVALPFSLAGRIALGQSRRRMRALAFWRALELVFLGVFLRSVGRSQTDYTFEDTLSQIGLGYVFLFLLAFRPARDQWIALGVILIGYWAAFALYPQPGTDFDYRKVHVPAHWPHLMEGFAAHWNKNSNLAWAFDTWFLNLFPRVSPFVANRGGYSTVSFIPALGTMILGLIASGVLRSNRRIRFKVAWLTSAGAVGLLAGFTLGWLGICPVVKRIWTPSWVLFSGGWCFLLLAAFFTVIDVLRWRRWSFPLAVIGMNSIAAYCMSVLLTRFIAENLETHLGKHTFEAFGAAYEPLLHGAAGLLVLWLVLYGMYRGKIFWLSPDLHPADLPIMNPTRPRLAYWRIAHAGSLPGRAEAEPPRTGELRRLREKIDGLLRAELTGGWYPRALDRELGGFRQNFARDWSPLPDENRFLVYQTRMTWTAAAFAAYSPPHRDEFVRYARIGIEYLDKVMRDREFGGFHWMLGPRGQVDPRLGDEKHVYATSFVLYAASKVYDVTRDDLALTVARDAFAWLEDHAHDAEHGGYFEAITREGKPILAWDQDLPIAKRIDRFGAYYGFKSMNAHIHLLEALTEFSKVEKTPLVLKRLREVHALVRDRIAAEPGALNSYLTRDWQAIPAHDSYGHDLETAFLLVEAAEALEMPEDPKTWHMARRMVDHALDWGWDGEHGGFYSKGEAFIGEAFDRHKNWWTQAEGLNALLLMHRKSGAGSDRYWGAFLKQWEFIERHFLDAEYGGWYMWTTRDGKLIGDSRKANEWKVNYHTTRAMIGVATMLRELEAALGQEPR